MSRFKLVAILFVLSFLVILTIVFLKFPSAFKITLPNNQRTSNVNQIPQSSIEPAGLIEGAKDAAAEKTQEVIKDITNNLNDKKQEILNRVLGQNTTAVLVSDAQNTPSRNSTDQLIILDLSQNNSLNLKLKKGVLYYILFKNVPKNTCFYLDNVKYEITNDKMLTIDFQKTGNFQLQTNSCDLNFKNHGQVSVE